MTTQHDMDLPRRLARDMGAAQAWVLAAPVEALWESLLPAGQEPVDPLSGPPIACLDLKERGRVARAEATPLVVDVTSTGPAGCAAVRLGAHLALAAIGERLSVAGVSRDAERVLPGCRQVLDELARQEHVDEDYARAQLEARARSWHEASDAAQVVAAYLRCHPAVEELRYPGLRDDPSFSVAARTLVGGFGPFVDYRRVGQDGWQRVVCTGEDPHVQVLCLERQLGGSLAHG